MIEKKEHFNNLLDVYGALLTEHQKEICRLYYQEDLSLQEISEDFNISRNAVFDNIKRVESSLEEYENKLGILKKENNSKFLVLISFEENNLEEINKLLKTKKIKDYNLIENKGLYLKTSLKKSIEIENYLKEKIEKYDFLVSKIEKEIKRLG